VLAADRDELADASELGDSEALVRTFGRPGEQRLFASRLLGVLWVDTARGQEQESLSTARHGGVEEVDLGAVVIRDNSAGRVALARDSADPGGGVDHDVWRGLVEELRGGARIAQVGFGRARPDEVAETVIDEWRQSADPTRPRCPAM
jgi:hypothetical protein